MADLDKVAVLQLDYRGLFGVPDKSGGPTLEEEFLQHVEERFSRDAMVNLAVCLEQITENVDQPSILREAITLLDHLETLGMEVRFKNNGRS